MVIGRMSQPWEQAPLHHFPLSCLSCRLQLQRSLIYAGLHQEAPGLHTHSPLPSPYQPEPTHTPHSWLGMHSSENRLKPQFRTHHSIHPTAYKAMFLSNRTFSSGPRTFRPPAQSLRRCYGLPRRHHTGLISATRTSSGRHEANNPAAIPAKSPSSPLLPSPETADAPKHLYDLVQQAGLILSMVDPSLKD